MFLYTNLIEGFFSIFETTVIGTYHQVSTKHLQQYSTETTYRFKTREIKDTERFELSISNTQGKLTYN